MTTREVVAILVIGSFILLATVAIAVMLVNERLDDVGAVTEQPVGGAHHAGHPLPVETSTDRDRGYSPSVGANSAF
jgi:hypothetical protein